MTLSQAEIRALLPHRFPILLVDRVTELVPRVSLRAVKCVTANEPCYQRLADGSPPRAFEYPPSLLLESFLQAAALFFAQSAPQPQAAAESVMIFGALSGCRFLRPVLPGEVLEHRVRPQRLFSDGAVLAGSSWVGDVQAADFAEAVVAVRPRKVMG